MLAYAARDGQQESLGRVDDDGTERAASGGLGAERGAGWHRTPVALGVGGSSALVARAATNTARPAVTLAAFSAATAQDGPVAETGTGALPNMPCGPNPGQCTMEWSYVQPGVHYINTSQYDGSFRVNVSLSGAAASCALGFGVSGGWNVIQHVFDATKVFDWAGAAFACVANEGVYIAANTYWN